MKGDRVYLAHVRDALARIAAYTADGREAFFTDSKTQDAVVRNLQVIGEAAKLISDATKSHAGDIPWRQVAGLRDQLVHRYSAIDLAIVWAVVEHEVPNLERAISRLLENEG